MLKPTKVNAVQGAADNTWVSIACMAVVMLSATMSLGQQQNSPNPEASTKNINVLQHIVFIVKENQPTLRQDISDLKLESFPPSAHHHR